MISNGSAYFFYGYDGIPVYSTMKGCCKKRSGGTYSVWHRRAECQNKKIGADLSVYNGDDDWELPLPGSYVLGQDGTIQLAFVDADYTRRLEPAAILEALEELRKS